VNFILDNETLIPFHHESIVHLLNVK